MPERYCNSPRLRGALVSNDNLIVLLQYTAYNGPYRGAQVVFILPQTQGN